MTRDSVIVRSRFASNPRDLELEGANAFLGIISEGRTIFNVGLIDEYNEFIDGKSTIKGPVALVFEDKPSDEKGFYILFVTEENYHNPNKPLTGFKKVFDLQFFWDYDNNSEPQKVYVTFWEMSLSGRTPVTPDEDYVYWTKYCNSTQILYEGISAFLSALQDNRYVIYMSSLTRGTGINEEVSIGFYTAPIEPGDNQLLFFGVYFGQQSICESQVEKDLEAMPGYEILDEVVLEDFLDNYFIATLFSRS